MKNAARVPGKFSLSIRLIEISKTGMAFVLQDNSIQVDDEVEIIFETEAGTRAIQTGRVVSQLVLCRGRSEGKDLALSRFSLEFHGELDEYILQTLRTLRLARPDLDALESFGTAS